VIGWIQRRWPLLLACAGLLVILVATLKPMPDQAAASRATPLWCLLCGQNGGVDVADNILLFVPLAFGLRLSGVARSRVLIAGAALSLTIELLQLSVIPGRDASLSDVLTNTLGTWLGSILAGRWPSLVRPTKRQALRLAAGGSMLWLILQSGTAYLLRPSVIAGPYLSEWVPYKAGRRPFNGSVNFAAVAGLPVPEGVHPDYPELSRRLRSGNIEVELALTSRDVQPHWSSVFQLFGKNGSVMLVEAFERSLVFQPPARAQLLRLNRPRVMIRNALNPGSGSEVRFAAGERHDTLWASVRRGPTVRQVSQALSPSLGWALISPFNYQLGRESRMVTFFWLVFLLAPIGYWWKSFRSMPGWLMASGGVLIVGLLGIPLILGYPPVNWSEWLGGLAGIALGSGPRSDAYLGKRCDSPSIRESC
jgi:VanZ family protein